MAISHDLKMDHKVVRRLEAALRVMADMVRKGNGPTGADLEEAMMLMTDFVDIYHHGKEETCLFPLVEGAHEDQKKTVHGFLVEHEFGRRAARMIRQKYERWAKGDLEAAEALARFILTYADFIKTHTEKEDVWFDVLDGRLLKPATVQQMFTPQKTRDGKPTGYGLGWYISERGGKKWVEHSGSQPGTSTDLLLLPERGLVVAVLTNLERAPARAIAMRVAELIMQ